MPVQRTNRLMKSKTCSSATLHRNMTHKNNRLHELIPAPAYLCPDAQEEWPRVIAALRDSGKLAADNSPFLLNLAGVYCQTIAHWREIDRHIRERGLMVQDPITYRGTVVSYRHRLNPAVAMRVQFAKELRSLVRSLGLITRQPKKDRGKSSITVHSKELNSADRSFLNDCGIQNN